MQEGTGRARWTESRAAIRVPRGRSDVAVEEIDGEGLLLDLRCGSVHRLNETALFVWRRCDGCRTTRQIADEMTGHYDTESSFALECVEQLLVRLAALQLLEEPQRIK